MKLPALLNGHTMTPKGYLRPLTWNLSIKADEISTATMQLDSNSPEVNVGDWVWMESPNGISLVMYVKSRNMDYIKGSYTITLEHTWNLLEEMVVFGENTAATMSGVPSATTIAIGDAITWLLGRQTETLWSLQTCDFNDAHGWKVTNTNIKDAIEDTMKAVLDCQLEFDQSTLPWKVSLKQWPTSTTMEMRRNRNIDSMSVTVNRQGMYTRVYPTGAKNLHIDSVNSNVSYLDRNTATYGVIAQVITDSSIKDANLLKAWAAKQLKKNSTPTYTVTIGGRDLSEQTGETMDQLRPGRLCRVPLPEYGVTVTERLVELNWQNIVLDPDNLKVTLANEHKTATSAMNEKSKGGGGGGKKSNTEHDCDLKEGEQRMDEYENADIWINRDSVWAVCGSYTVTTWTEQGVTKKKLKVNDGCALTIERNSTEYGLFDEGNLTAGVMIGKLNDGSTQLKITADVIDINGLVSALSAYSVQIVDLNAVDGEFTGELKVTGGPIIGYDYVQGTRGKFSDLDIDDGTTSGIATWQSYSARKCTLGNSYYFVDYLGTQHQGRLVTGYSDTTLHYLGKAST